MRSADRPRTLPLLAFLMALAPPVALATPFTDKGTQPGLAFPLLKASNCAGCHGDFDPARNVEPHPTWAGSMMAHSARDPLFWAALDVANNDVPGVGEWCLRCHAPDAWLAGRSHPGTDGCALLGKLDETGNDFDGVSCHFCHRLQVNPSPPPGQLGSYIENAQFWLDDGNCGGSGEPCRRGPFNYPPGGPTPPPHAWADSAYHRGSEVCAVCHNVTSPVRNLIEGGTDTGLRFPIERTYGEWQFSAFALPGPDRAECQDCHMPVAAADPVFACSFGLNNRAGELGIHQFAGGNAWVPDVLRQAYPNLGLDDSFAFTRAAALDLLQNQSAAVELTAPSAVLPGASANLAVKVTNLTGHKLPTGYPEGRRMWLHVEARDGNDALIWESGGYDAGTGTLTDDAQLKVYEAKQGTWNRFGTNECDTETPGGAALFHFARNDCYVSDNRIPPLGFFGAASPEVAPRGYSYPETTPGSGILVNYDLTSYTLPIPSGAATPVTFRATLRYQTISKEYVDFLDDQATDNSFPDDCIERTSGFPGKTRAAVLRDFWLAYDKAPPVDMAGATHDAAVRVNDPFMCYQARPTNGSPKLSTTLALTNAFDDADFAVNDPASLCAPADADGSGTIDGTTFLEAYRAKISHGEPAHVRRVGLTVQDALGTITVDTVRPEAVLVPSAESESGPPAPPGPNPVDLYTCYKVRRTKGSPKFPRGLQVAVGDHFTAPAAVLDVKKPRRLCLPTDAGAAIKQPTARLMCYVVKTPRGSLGHVPRAGLYTTNQLGAGRLDTKRSELLCLPATVTP